jgi:hypothetical protein
MLLTVLSFAFLKALEPFPISRRGMKYRLNLKNADIELNFPTLFNEQRIHFSPIFFFFDAACGSFSFVAGLTCFCAIPDSSNF